MAAFTPKMTGRNAAFVLVLGRFVGHTGERAPPLADAPLMAQMRRPRRALLNSYTFSVWWPPESTQAAITSKGRPSARRQVRRR